MITCFHFVRLIDTSQRQVVLADLRGALPTAVVAEPADPHAEAAWDLSLHQPVSGAAEAAALRARVGEVLEGREKVHKHWCMTS